MLALELVKGGASSLASVIHLDAIGGADGSGGALGSFGLGWFLACILLSGSPVAALSLCFLAEETISLDASFAMVMGSRIGASFVVLAIGFVYDLRARGSRGGTYVGALALLTTASVYLPAWGLGDLLLGTGWLEDLPLPQLGGLVSFIDLVLGFVLDGARAAMPGWLEATTGIVLLLCAFKLFDLTLPAVDPTGGKLGRLATTIFRPPIAFLLGMVMTAITLSVSVSLTLLVPLTVRGIVRRENIIPFILGANITTFADTIVTSLLVGSSKAVTVVACAVVVVSCLSVPIVFLTYRPYERVLDRLASWVTRDSRRLAAFVALLFLVPWILILLNYLS